MATADDRTKAFNGRRGNRSSGTIGHGEQVLLDVRQYAEGHAPSKTARQKRVQDFGRALMQQP